MNSIVLGDFQPVNAWIVDEEGEAWKFGPEVAGERTINGTLYLVFHNGDLRKASNYSSPTKLAPKYLIDKTTNRKYWNETTGCVRAKCIALALGTFIIHAIAAVLNVAYRVLKLMTFYHFWVKEEGETPYSFKARVKNAGQDALRIVTTPFTLIGLEFAALYGIARPYDGRKLYATFERAQYGQSILAPCFQPSPRFHALGGDPQKQGAW